MPNYLIYFRLQNQGEDEMKAASKHIDELAAQIAAAELDISEKEDEIQGLQVILPVICRRTPWMNIWTNGSLWEQVMAWVDLLLMYNKKHLK